MSCAITKRSSPASHNGSHTLILAIPINLWNAPDNLSHWLSWWVLPLDQRAHGCPGTALGGAKAMLHFSYWVMGLPLHALCMLFLFSPLRVCRQAFFSHNLTNIYCLFLRWTKLSTERVVGPWTGFPRAVVPTPSFSEFKVHLDNALNHAA